ncbi:MAG: hypothetical protein CMJ31_03370 [Phycisphaerae bacterium]|nr:hypothetical protein [Phycisphaerae bacterium]
MFQGITAALLGLIAVTVAPVARAGQEIPEDELPVPVMPTPELIAPPPPAAVIAAFEAIEAAVRTGEVEKLDDAELPAATVASVTFRRLGSVMASSTAIATPNKPEDDTLRRAFAEAWERAERFAPRHGDALDEARLQAFRDEIAIEIEVSGAFVPLLDADFILDPTDPLRLPTPPLNPGHEGFAARLGRFVSAVTPGQMLRDGVSARQAMTRSVGQVSDDPKAGLEPLATLRLRAVELFKFEVAHIAQREAGGPPRFLSRGGAIESLSSVSGVPALVALSNGIISQIETRMWPGVEPYGLRGDYDPILDSHDPRVAPPFEQGLVAAALLMASEAPYLGDEISDRAKRLAMRIVDGLGEIDEEAEDDPAETPIDAAATAWAIGLVDPQERRESVDSLLERCVDRTREAFDPAEGFVDDVPVGARGLLALALVVNADDDAELTFAERAVRAAFEGSRGAKLVSQMPFLFWAEQRLAANRGIETLPSAVALREMRDRALTFQLRSDDVDPRDEDLIGGIVLLTGRDPLPTSQGLRPIAALASMLGDPSLTPRDDPSRGELTIKQLMATRFLGQLAASEAESYMYRRPAKARYGVRAAPWDQSMPNEAAALGLMTLSETLKAFDNGGGRR